MQIQERAVLDHVGLRSTVRIWHNLSPAELYEHAIRRGEASLMASGALEANTGPFTGRSPEDKFLVREASTESSIWWHGGNHGIPEESFDALLQLMVDFCETRDVYVQDVFACADPRRRLRVRVISELAWHSLFARNLFIRPTRAEHADFRPDFTVLALPSVMADPAQHGVRSETFVVLNFARRMVLIGGTQYAGEIKKSIFSVLNLLLPEEGVMPMHCSANRGAEGNVALFFGLSGTGKTTLSSDPTRLLIGDDEHGWSDHGVFNFEGGCYAKTIRISKAAEPQIYSATESFGTVLENVGFDPDTRIPDYDDGSRAENTRAAYPIELIANADPLGQGGHPDNVLFLSADAYGVLPPVARLNEEQIRFFFLSGYTAKVAGTERGVTEPQPTFSTCFAAPFLPLPPNRYADMLVQRVRDHGARVWMLNTGWQGGVPGVGERISIAHTRAIVRAVVENRLLDVATVAEPVFGLEIPVAVPDVPAGILRPRDSWSDPAAYDEAAASLRARFESNFARFAPLLG